MKSLRPIRTALAAGLAAATGALLAAAAPAAAPSTGFSVKIPNAGDVTVAEVLARTSKPSRRPPR